MNHLLRSLAPVSDSAWELLDGEAAAADTRAGRAQAGRLLRPARLGALGHQPRAHAALSSAPEQGVTGAGAACSRWPSCERTSPSPGGASRPRPRRASTWISTRSTKPPTDRRRRERRRLPRLGGGGDHGYRRGLAAQAESARRAPRELFARGRRRRRAAAVQRRRRTVRHRARPRAVPARRRDRRARRVSAARPPAQDPRAARSCGRLVSGRGRAQPARRRLHLRLRPGPVDRLSTPRRGHRAPVHPGELQLPRATPDAAVALTA